VDLDGIIDTGCMVSMVPESIVQKLGLRIKPGGGVKIYHAGGGYDVRAIAEDMRTDMMGRNCNVNCIVGPEKSVMLIGQNIIEELDIIIEPAGDLHFRDPDMIVLSAYHEAPR
jgi:hypothetical protein